MHAQLLHHCVDLGLPVIYHAGARKPYIPHLHPAEATVLFPVVQQTLTAFRPGTVSTLALRHRLPVISAPIQIDMATDAASAAWKPQMMGTVSMLMCFKDRQCAEAIKVYEVRWPACCPRDSCSTQRMQHTHRDRGLPNGSPSRASCHCASQATVNHHALVERLTALLHPCSVSAFYFLVYLAASGAVTAHSPPRMLA